MANELTKEYAALKYDKRKNEQRCRPSADMRCGRPPSYAQTALTYFEFQLRVHLHKLSNWNQSKKEQ